MRILTLTNGTVSLHTGVKLWAGRNSLPFWKQNELFWDDDVTPAGAGFNYKNEFEDGFLEVNAGYLVLPAELMSVRPEMRIKRMAIASGLILITSSRAMPADIHRSACSYQMSGKSREGLKHKTQTSSRRKSMQTKRSIIPTVALVFLSWTVSDDAPAKESITYVGSSTVGRFMHAAAKEYAGASFSINTEPESAGGENAVAAGKADIGGVARDVSPAILAKGVHKHRIGRDAIGIWVNSENPVTDLSMAQLKAIYTGKTTNWKDVGGPDLAINVYIVNPQSATRKVFKKVVLEGDRYAGSRLQTVRPDPAIIDRIQSDEGG
ncbi:MAG: substrate-binding domain-containing protein, partial [Candidatus Tectomicrobia bacterium]|nr:substrate-binding domain-containing protein [Candidatus Tectomicrobia bacterium]